ncbi:MAG: hypothetical protein ACYC8T_00760 [Myxococcaceae bacterium]
MAAAQLDENASSSPRLSALWTDVLVQLDATELPRPDGDSVETLGDIAESIVSGVFAVERFNDGAAGVAKTEVLAGPRFPAESCRILVLERAVAKLAEDELKAVLIREFFRGLLVYTRGPEHVLGLSDAEQEQESDELMRDLGFEPEADLVECLSGEWPLDSKRG